jgi:nucleoid-associated protein YgaU
MFPTKAKIEVLDKDAVDPSGNIPQEFFDVQFNPTEYTLNKAAQIAEINIIGIDSPILQFIRGQNEKLTLDLFFDTTAMGGLDESAQDVKNLTKPFYQLVKIQPKTHAPPRIRFTWGEGLSFKAIVESIQQKFTLFSPNGIPLRATLSVTFREYRTLEEQLKELKLQSSDHSKQRVVRQGDTLSRIAGQEYNDPGQWRMIADNNADVLTDVLDLQPGTVLLIPPLDVISASGGGS